MRPVTIKSPVQGFAVGDTGTAERYDADLDVWLCTIKGITAPFKAHWLTFNPPPAPAAPAPAKAATVAQAGGANPTEAERQTEIVATVTLKYPPTNNTFKKPAIINGRSRMVLTKRSRDYKAEAKKTAIDAAIPKAIGPVSVTVKVFRPRKIGDLENTFKCVFDAMTGVAYEDDGQIEEIHAYRFDDKANPRVELTIKEMKGQE